jgi:hypothetical protein
MEIRGVGGTSSAQDLQTGRFYRRQDYDGGTILFQVIEDARPEGVSKWALEFRPSSVGGARIEEIYGNAAFSEIPNVHLRVDPTSLAGDEHSTSTRAGMLLITGETALLLATPQRNYGWVAVDLGAGKLASTRPTGWAWFSRWSLVVDAAEDETELVAYDLARRTP